MRREGNVEGKDRNKPNSHLMTSLSIILNPFTVPRCENRISLDRKDLMAVSGLWARDHHFLPRQISSATCPHKSPFQTDKSFEHKIMLEKDTWQIFMAFILSPHPHPSWKNGGKNCRTDDVAILRSFVNCQPGLTLQKTNREHGGSARLHGEEEGRESALVFTNKETFCRPFAAPVKSATNMEIRYRQLLQKCDQSLCSQLGTGNWGRCLSADGQKRLCRFAFLSCRFLGQDMYLDFCIYQSINILSVYSVFKTLRNVSVMETKWLREGLLCDVY